MKYYAGLDVSMKATNICILNEEGKRIFEGQAPTDPQAIQEELSKGGVELEKVGLETGSLSKYLTKGLQALGVKAICIDARKMAAILSVTVNKTDKNAAIPAQSVHKEAFSRRRKASRAPRELCLGGQG